MAAYTSTKSGNWSDSTVWGGTPTAADACVIANTHTVTLAAAQTTPIHSDIKKVNAITVKGVGTTGDPWNPV